MELVERYSFFHFWNTEEHFERATWSEAAARWPEDILPIERMLQSVHEELDPAEAARVLDLVRWRFCPALDVHENRTVRLPLDWFKKLSEFNGSSAGNTPEESVLQGACELVERHVSDIADAARPELPTIDPASCDDPVFRRLLRCYEQNGVQVLLKDLSMGMPVPTVAALAMDPSTFPGLSEIVFTAGTATTPVKAAIRALTEVAQLGGDFSTGSVYEASGLSKFTEPRQADWLRAGPVTPLAALPDGGHADILDELTALARGLDERGYRLYAVDTSSPDLDGLAANYNIVPGLRFRERDRHASLGLFVGRILAEEAEEAEAEAGLAVLEEVYGPEAHFLPFFRGLLALRTGDPATALAAFDAAEPLQPDAANRALAAFYAGYCATSLGDWRGAEEPLTRAIGLDGEVKEYHNLRGVARFKQQRYAEAARDFSRALDIDRGSVMDLANLGVCHKFLGDANKARDYLETALELDPSLDFARAHLDELLGGAA
jgi:ribosomal protein S12 methylthiotransferase accessory factor